MQARSIGCRLAQDTGLAADFNTAIYRSLERKGRGAPRDIAQNRPAPRSVLRAKYRMPVWQPQLKPKSLPVKL